MASMTLISIASLISPILLGFSLAKGWWFIAALSAVAWVVAAIISHRQIAQMFFAHDVEERIDKPADDA